MATSNSPFQRRYPPELRERAVRMVREAIAESGERVGAVTRVARQLGIGPESLRNWVKQADIDHGKNRPGVTTDGSVVQSYLQRADCARARVAAEAVT